MNVDELTGSMDSLLSSTAADSDYSSAATANQTCSDRQGSSSPHPHPPPALPLQANHDWEEERRPQKQQSQKKRVSISAIEAEVIDTPALQRKRDMAAAAAAAVSAAESDDVEPSPPPPPTVVVPVISSAATESDAEALAALPSVKELASKFMMPKGSPEPAPRKSIAKAVRSLLHTEQIRCLHYFYFHYRRKGPISDTSWVSRRTTARAPIT